MVDDWSRGSDLQPIRCMDVGVWSTGGERTTKQLYGGLQVVEGGGRTAKRLDGARRVVNGGGRTDKQLDVGLQVAEGCERTVK